MYGCCLLLSLCYRLAVVEWCLLSVVWLVVDVCFNNLASLFVVC